MGVLALCIGAGSSAGDGEAARSAPVETPVPRSVLLGFLADNSTLTLIDARSPEEYAVSHIAGAINVPHDAPDGVGEALPSDKDQLIVVYCMTGKRAAVLRDALTSGGYRDVRVLQPKQIFWAGNMAVFNCSTPRDPPDLLAATTPRNSGEEGK